MPYQSVTNIENSVTNAAGGANAAFTQLVTLPNASWEGRTSHAVKIASGGGERIGIYFVGGLHAREWGSSDILVRFIDRVTQAFRTGNTLTFGGTTFTAAQVASVVNTLNLYVFPQANPDGRQYSMASDVWWRKNRRPDPTPANVGVDVNRNFDFLWNYPTFFSPSAPVASSTVPSSEVYIGPSAESEPETRNIVSIVDHHTEIRFFVDVHSYSQLILYGWGDDEQQTTDPGKNFANAAFNGQRGVAGDAYREFIPAGDRDLEESLGLRMRDAIVAAGGPAYTVEPSYGLYPTSGTSTERFFMRHFLNRRKGKVHGYTIEWGTQFQPPWSEMDLIADQVCAALFQLCLGVLATHSDVFIRDNAADTGTAPSGDPFWESPDIVVRNTDDGTFAHEDPRLGQDNFLYVKVHNRGPNPTGPMEVFARAVAYAGTEFVYPHDWTVGDATHLVATPIAATTTNVAVGGEFVARFRLTAAQVGQLGTWVANGWHPCLLAEVDCTTDYGSPAFHVWTDDNLAQRNISVLPALAGSVVKWAFLVGHELIDRRHLSLDLHLVDMPRDAVVTLDLLDTKHRFPAVVDVIRTPVAEPALVGGPDKGAGTVEEPVAPALRDLHPRLAPFVRGLKGIDVVGDDAPLLRLSEEHTRLDLRHVPRSLTQAVLNVTVPDTAKAGEVYRVRVAQHDGNGEVVGGVTLEVPIVDRLP
jgi:carboxypeptidase T